MAKRKPPSNVNVAEKLWLDVIDGWRNPKWVSHAIGNRRAGRDEPFADARQAIGRMLKAGASSEDLCELARFIAYETTFSVLMELGCTGLKPTEIEALHEELLSADPSGNEGRTASAARPAGKAPSPGTAWPAHLPRVTDAAFSPDSNLLAVGRTSTTATTIKVLSKSESAPAIEFPALKNLRAITFSEDCKSIFVGNHDGFIARHDLATGRQLWKSRSLKYELHEIILLPQHRLLAVPDALGALYLLDANTGTDANSIQLDPTWLVSEAAAVHNGSELILQLLQPGVACCIATADIPGRRIVRQSPWKSQKDHGVGGIAAANHSALTLCRGGKEILELNVETIATRSWMKLDAIVRRLEFSADDKSLLAVLDDGWLLIDTASRSILHRAKHESLRSCQLSPDGSAIALLNWSNELWIVPRPIAK